MILMLTRIRRDDDAYLDHPAPRWRRDYQPKNSWHPLAAVRRWWRNSILRRIQWGFVLPVLLCFVFWAIAIFGALKLLGVLR